MEIEKEIPFEKDFDVPSVRDFYKGQIVFLTGATGFIGKVILEKLLRTTEVKKIYILIRKKRDKDIKERAAEIFEDPLFQVLHREKRDYYAKIHPIAGECSIQNLGISKSDQQLLRDNVNIVIHGAATVRFNEPLKSALDINVRATCSMLEMAEEMKNLKCFLHVSSAFANCHQRHIEEKYYDAGITGEKACLLTDVLSHELLDKICHTLVDKFPNTYTYTKAIAEELVLKHGKRIPLCIFRPGIVIPTYMDPVPGWIDNLYGPTSILIGAATGVLRVIFARMDQNAHIVPVDYCANAMMAIMWKTAKDPSPVPPIYNYTPEVDNMVKWEAYRMSAVRDGTKMPITRLVWYPCLTVTESKFWYHILCFFYHYIPAVIFDIVFLLMGHKRRMLKVYKRIHKSSSLLDYFVKYDWTFNTTNIQNLWKEIGDSDKELYPFNLKHIDWTRQFYNSMCGVRRYLAKEEPKTIPKAIKIHQRLWLLHKTLMAIIYGIGICLLLMVYSRIFNPK